MISKDGLTPQEMENFWEYNYKRLDNEFRLYRQRYEALLKSYNDLLQKVYDNEYNGK